MSTPKQAFAAGTVTISDYASLGGTHLAGDATFPDGQKYRFVMRDGVVDRLYLYNISGSYPHNNWANRAPTKAKLIAEHALPYLPEALKQKAARDAAEDAKNRKEQEAHAKQQALQEAAPDLLAALQRAVEYFDDNGGESSYTWLPEMKAAIAKAQQH